MINENVAYAKSILSKKGIGVDSTEYADYLKIRDICGTNNGYVGILTKIRFIDNVTDMDEISSIFDILKNSKIDIAKMNKMSYDGDKLRPYQKLPHQFDNIYVAFSITYSGPFAMMLYSKYEIVLQYPALIKDVSYTTLSDYSMGIIESELLNSDYIISYGLKLKLGKITMGEIQKNDKFICKIDKWLVFHHNENYYLILNTELESYQIPTYSLDKFNYDMVDPLYWYLNKKTKTPYNTKKSYDFHDIVRNEIDRIEKEQKDGGKGIKGFFDFLK